MSDSNPARAGKRCLNVLLSEQDHQKLLVLSRHYRVTMAALVRDAIIEHSRMLAAPNRFYALDDLALNELMGQLRIDQPGGGPAKPKSRTSKLERLESGVSRQGEAAANGATPPEGTARRRSRECCTRNLAGVHENVRWQK